jgi:hypothetical protein
MTTYHPEVITHLHDKATTFRVQQHTVELLQSREANNDLTEVQRSTHLAALKASHKCTDRSCPVKLYEGHAEVVEEPE